MKSALFSSTSILGIILFGVIGHGGELFGLHSSRRRSATCPYDGAAGLGRTPWSIDRLVQRGPRWSEHQPIMASVKGGLDEADSYRGCFGGV
jgi:hypothetical protein